MTQTGNLNKTIQAQRFDRWKDPQGVIEACKSARRTTDCMLVLVGSKADDDPKTAAVLESVQASASERDRPFGHRSASRQCFAAPSSRDTAQIHSRGFSAASLDAAPLSSGS